MLTSGYGQSMLGHILEGQSILVYILIYLNEFCCVYVCLIRYYGLQDPLADCSIVSCAPNMGLSQGLEVQKLCTIFTYIYIYILIKKRITTQFLLSARPIPQSSQRWYRQVLSFTAYASYFQHASSRGSFAVGAVLFGIVPWQMCIYIAMIHPCDL